MFGKLKGYKTYVSAALAVIGPLAGYLTGELPGPAAFQVVVTAVLAACGRHAIGGGLGKTLVALVWLLPALFLTGCGLTETGTAPKGVSFDLVSGVCYTTADGKFRGCYNPLSRTVTVVRTGVTGSAALVYDAGTKVWRGTAPDGTSVVWDQVHGLRTEPALPVVSSK